MLYTAPTAAMPSTVTGIHTSACMLNPSQRAQLRYKAFISSNIAKCRHNACRVEGRKVRQAKTK